jgi:hypothetical protein
VIFTRIKFPLMMKIMSETCVAVLSRREALNSIISVDVLKSVI